MDSLTLRDLRVDAGSRRLLDGVGFRLEAGSIVALVGESGGGKSLTARSCLGLVPVAPGVVGGELEIAVGGQVRRPYAAPDRDAAFAAVRGGLVGWLPQDGRAALDPLWTVRRHLGEVLELAGLSGASEERHRWLRRAGFADPAAVEGLYPHELSGGMAQRASLALALARGSRFLLADEPTTGLDPSIQEGLLRQLGQLREGGLGILLITHDLRIAARAADRVLVMHQGRIVDDVAPGELGSAKAEATRRLVASVARISGGRL